MKKLYAYEVNETIDTTVLIKQADIRTAKNGNPFIAFTFQDRSGAMDGKYWSATPEEIERYQTGRVVHLIGRREIFNSQPQVRIEKLFVLEDTDPNNDPSLYMESAPMTKDEMSDALQYYLFKITDGAINRIVRNILNQTTSDFFTFPAAKRHHHAFSGGLGFHTISILKIAEHLIEQYDQLNPSLLYAGAILHDIGKTIELSGAVGTEYTLAGNLLGHIVIVDEMIATACQELDIDQANESVILLKHMILSHHGKLEYGSPVRPQIMEAEVLHQLDMLDATMNMLQSALDKTPAGEYSPRIFGLDNRAFYKPLK
ncbi:3'-5' exoribonuclease YhaM family protein [Atopobacter phocae]|uniref:3'-5' exoribonuclease YhaM family protein n=1 Tax=Atopobacter phocae TaxID=136492 RepID=UPI00046E73C5|nr:HD domain-containing protein [Atopobacter phocae]